MVRAAGERIPMNNSIWKVLTALGVAGIGVFFVIQVQGRLAAQKKNDPQAAVAAADNATGSDTAAAEETPPDAPEQAAAATASTDESPFNFGEPESTGEIRTASFQANPADPPADNGASVKTPPDERFFSDLEEPAATTAQPSAAPAAASEPVAVDPPVTAEPVSSEPVSSVPAVTVPQPAVPTPAAELPQFPAAAAAEFEETPQFVVPESVPDFPASEPTTSPAMDNTEPPEFTEPAPFQPDTVPQPEPFPAETPDFGEQSVPLPRDTGASDAGTDLPSLDSQSMDRGGRSIPSAGQQAQPNIPESMRPHLSIQKQAPKTATVGVPIEYRIILRNEGDMAAYDLQIEDELGSAAELISAMPQPDNSSGGTLRWSIGELAAGASREMIVRVRPTGEGTLDGTATVSFSAQVRSATVIRSPRLQLEVAGPSAVKLGSEVPLQFRITNRGSGDAANVVLRSVLPPGLRHPEGADLEYSIDLLRAGETETVDLTVAAAEPGEQVRVSAEIEAEGTAPTTGRTEINIVGSQLIIERTGPEKRYVNHPARFQNLVKNETQFDASGAYVVEQVPEGMRVESVGGGGKYDPTTRQVRWDLPVIGPGRGVVLDLGLVPEVTGKLESRVAVVESAGFRSEAKDNTIVVVEGIHNVTADISRQDKPVAVGERFGFTVTIDNRGTAEARNVQISLQVPAEIEVIAAGTREIPGKLLPGNVVRYDKVVTIRPNEQMKFQVTLRGRQIARNAVVQAQLKYDEMDRPLIVSESVTVYDDKL
jgi:uncharacterized repeat protein (TIGR01451 family)